MTDSLLDSFTISIIRIGFLVSIFEAPDSESYSLELELEFFDYSEGFEEEEDEDLLEGLDELGTSGIFFCSACLFR